MATRIGMRNGRRYDRTGGGARGKLPDRLDIPSIGVDPVAKIDAHLAMLEDELT
jgi:hypothetical protein